MANAVVFMAMISHFPHCRDARQLMGVAVQYSVRQILRHQFVGDGEKLGARR